MNQRFLSLDIFRGATVAAMILVNNPGSWSNMFSPLQHAPWHGCTPTDLVFPFFLFAVGNAMAFVMPRLEAAGTGAFFKKVLTRAALIYIIGLLLTWWPFIQWREGALVFKHWVNPENPESGIRILGVLPRIAIAYLFASIIVFFTTKRTAAWIGIGILLAYWALSYWLGKPGDPYSLNGFFGTAIDKTILGVAHMYKGEGVPFDPEGLVSTIPAIVQVIFGYLAGAYIRLKGKSWEMLAGLFLAGCLLAFAGLFWDLSFPINKKIWTSSYVLYTTGLALLVISVILYAVEFRNKTGWHTRFFTAFGKNALFIFVLSGLIPKTLSLLRWSDGVNANGNPAYTSPLPWFYKNICRPLFEDPRIASLLYAIVFLILLWAIAAWMDRKKIYIRV